MVFVSALSLRGMAHHKCLLYVCKREKKSRKIGKKEEKSGRKGKNREGLFTLALLTDRAGFATTCSYYKIYRVEAVGPKNYNYT